MKIGIITYWDSADNYGQLLQCYALQAFLRSRGHAPFLIRYKPSSKKEFKLSKLNPAYIFKYLRLRYGDHNGELSSVHYDFDSFRDHINKSEKIYYGFSQLVAEDWSDVDAFICGSDQIWSPKSDEQLKSYFLQFTPFQKLRIAYAPSFGRTKLDPDYEAKLKDLLKGFDAISVREDRGKDFVEAAGYEAQVVVDPTLLLGSTVYSKEFGIDLDNKTNSLFCYFINWAMDWDEEDIKKFCSANLLEPKLFTTKGFKTSIPLAPIQSPEEWLRALAGARFSVINSFHGLVFSIIFHIPFAVYLLTGKQAAMNGRIHSLLGQLGMMDRIIDSKNTLQKISGRPIDWDDVDRRLNEMRASSVKFITDALAITTAPSVKKHNICFLSHGCIHHKYGGLDRVTEMLADRFAADGHRVYYLSAVNRGEIDQARQHFLPDSTDIFSKANQDYLDRFLSDHDIDVLINQEGNVNMCIPLTKRAGLRVFTCLHFNPSYINDNHMMTRYRNSNPLMRHLGSLVYNIKPLNDMALGELNKHLGANYKANLEWTDRFILLSPRFRRVLVDILPDHENIEKIEAIHNPAATVDSLPSFPREKTILYVGRLDNNFKRIDVIIKDMGVVLEANPDWKFIICGDGPDREYLTQLARATSDRIILAGYCDPTDYYRKASVIVMRSSRSEGWGMVLIEAMSHGVVPVAALTYASLPDIIDSDINGLITENTSEDFCNKLNSLLADPVKLEAMSLKAYEKVDEFSTDSIIAEWYKLIER